MFLRNI